MRRQRSRVDQRLAREVGVGFIREEHRRGDPLGEIAQGAEWNPATRWGWWGVLK